MIDGLPRGQRSRVFRRICQQLMTDPVLSSVVKTWDTWDGDADHASDVLSLDPMVRLTPQLGPVDWYSPDAQMGSLDIKIEIGVDSFNADDCLDLWEVFERAIYPYNDAARQLAFERDLQCLGSNTGQITFSNPASIQSASSGQFLCLGMMRLDIIRAFNP